MAFRIGIETNGGDDGTRTCGLWPDRAAGIGFTTTTRTRGVPKYPQDIQDHHELWVGDLPSPAARKISPFRTWTSVKPCNQLRYAARMGSAN